jgi:hypothetical protein
MSNHALKHSLRLVKPAVAVLTCAWIVSLADWDEVVQALPAVNAMGLAATFALMVLSVPLSAYKWKVLLDIHGTHYPLSTLTRYYFVAMFLNNLLPSGIGGDGYRVYKTFNRSPSRSSALLAVVTERLTGLAALLLLAYVASLVIYAQSAEPLAGAVVVAGTLMMCAMPILVWVARRGWLLGRFYSWLGSFEIVKVILGHAGAYRRDRRRFVRVIYLSFLFHAHALLFYWLLLYSVGGSCSIFELTVAVAAMSLAAVLPVSVNGLGVMDGAFVFALVGYGVGYEYALLAVLVWRLNMILISAAGGIVYAIGTDGRVGPKKRPGLSSET